MAAEAAGKRTRKDAKEPPRVQEKKSKVEDDSQDDFGLSSDIKGILKAIESVKEKSQASSKKLSSERLASLTKEVTNALDVAVVKAGNENLNLRKCVETTRQYESRLKHVTESFEKEAKKFQVSCKVFHTEREKILAEYENSKEKLDRKIEQQRRKDKTEYANLQKLCTEKLREAEEILSKQKREAKSISVLRKSLGTILEDSAEGFEDTDFEE